LLEALPTVWLIIHVADEQHGIDIHTSPGDVAKHATATVGDATGYATTSWRTFRRDTVTLEVAPSEGKSWLPKWLHGR
jgi:hypothetical protein